MRKSTIAYLGIAAAVAAADQALKYRAETQRRPQVHNRGAFLNLGQQRPALIRASSAVITAIALALFIGSLTFAGKDLLKLGLSLLSGGAFSNTYDRLKRKYVVDYWYLRGPKALRSIAYNLADAAIMIGAALAAAGA